MAAGPCPLLDVLQPGLDRTSRMTQRQAFGMRGGPAPRMPLELATQRLNLEQGRSLPERGHFMVQTHLEAEGPPAGNREFFRRRGPGVSSTGPMPGEPDPLLVAGPEPA